MTRLILLLLRELVLSRQHAIVSTVHDWRSVVVTEVKKSRKPACWRTRNSVSVWVATLVCAHGYVSEYTVIGHVHYFLCELCFNRKQKESKEDHLLTCPSLNPTLQ